MASVDDFGFIPIISGLTVKFRLTGQVPSTMPVDWDFGDSKQEYNKRNVTHTYEESGFYQVTVSYTNTKEGKTYSYSQVLVVNIEAKTSLNGSIYDLIDYYIPDEIVTKMSLQEKQMYINKWQLYIHPLVNHSIPAEDYNNELYYEGLENQLIMELAVYDFLNARLYNLLAKAGQYLHNVTGISEEETDAIGNSRGDRIKQITTGPTEVQYFDTLSDSIANLYSTYYKALQPGGLLDTIKKNLCILAERLQIFLPFCQHYRTVVPPKVVNRRNPHKLGGPNPTFPLTGGGEDQIFDD